MHYPIHTLRRVFIGLFMALLLFPLHAQKIKKATNHFKTGNYTKAKATFEKLERRKRWKPAAQLYLEAIDARQNQTIAEHIGTYQKYCDLLPAIQQAKRCKKRKFERHGITPALVKRFQNNTYATAFGMVQASRDIFQADSLADYLNCAPRTAPKENTTDKPERHDPEFEKLRDSIVNQSVYSQDYDVATRILERHALKVWPQNMEALWDLRDRIWFLFSDKYDLCLMDTFRIQHPKDPHSRDCWFDEVRDLMCTHNLDSALWFHEQNRFTIFEYEVTEAILEWEPQKVPLLNAAQQQHREDLLLLYQLRRQINGCNFYFDTTVFVEKVAYYAKKYAPRRTAIDLVEDGIDYLLRDVRYLKGARQLGNEMPPYFPDSVSCERTPNFHFQTGKQAWFRKYNRYLQLELENLSNRPMHWWNTKENDEFSAVMHSSGAEVFFARTNHLTRKTNIMQSKQDSTGWTPPKPVAAFANRGLVEPLSITEDGRMMLLSINKDIYISLRPNLTMDWMAPVRVKMPEIPHLGRMTLVPNAQGVVFDGSMKKRSPYRRPSTDLYYAPLSPDGSIGTPILLRGISSPTQNERNPILGMSGHSLFFSSDDEDGFGASDMYATSRKKLDNWAKWDTTINLGIGVNSVYDDLGFTHIPEHGGDALYNHENRCTDDWDIWAIDLPRIVTPDSLLRINGLVLDLDGRPHPGGFMEITVNASRAPIHVPIQTNGSYSYTINGGANIIRLYPSVPGLVTLTDRVYYPDFSKKQGIIRDTFYLFTFEDMRNGYRLKYAKFNDNDAVLNNDSIYSELTLLHHIAERMGAELRFVGHTDSSGTEARNQTLAMERALAVQRYMVEKCGFPAEKTTVVGMGPSKPRCPNNTPEGQRCNRRVEVLFLLPKQRK